MTKEELKKLKTEAAKTIRAEAKEKGLSKEETDKLVAEAIAKIEAENPAPAVVTGPKKYVVKTPVKNYCGVRCGVHFAYGKAEVFEGPVLDYFIRKGYEVEEVK